MSFIPSHTRVKQGDLFDVKTEPKESVRMLDEHTIEVNLPNKLGYERIAMACSATFAKIVGFLPGRIEDLKTAVSEACLNAMEHGNLNHPEKRVFITMDYKDHIFRVTVMDQGGELHSCPEPPPPAAPAPGPGGEPHR